MERGSTPDEARGREWQLRSDEFLVGYVADSSRPPQFQAPALIEMQRRVVEAIDRFNSQSSAQARTMIILTRWIIGLTVVIGLLAALQLGTAIWRL